MKYFISVLAFLLIIGCSPQKRMAKLIRKHPELLKTIQVKTIVRDTTIYTDTFYTPGFTDSFFIDTSVKDTTVKKSKYEVRKTIINGKEHFKFKVYRDTLYNTDTLYKDLETIVPGKVIDLTPKWVHWIIDNWTILAFLTLALTLILLYKRKSGG